MEKEDYKINDIYQGGYSSLDQTTSNTGIYTGYKIPSGQLGAPTKPDVANQLAQVSMLANQGIIPIEVGALNPEVFNAIPKEHFKEINRMSKLTGTDISVHAPLIEASGVTDQGWEEASRELAERELKDVVDRTSPMNEKGGMSITIHGAVKIPGKEYIITPEGKKEQRLYIINQDSGKIGALKSETTHLPGMEDLKKGEISTPRDELNKLNSTEWDNKISQLVHHKEDAETLLKENLGRLTPEILQDLARDKRRIKLLTPQKREAYERIRAARHFLQDTHKALNGLFDKAYKYGTKEDKLKLGKASEDFKKDLEKNPSYVGQAQAIGNLLEELEGMKPQTYIDLEEFTIDKSAKTFGNVAFHAFENYKDKAPVINIENFHPGSAYSNSEELKDLIVRSRKEFVDKAVSHGYSKSQAEKEAEKVIGITLDVGHLNMMRKKGYKEKDLLKEVKNISKYVKHVHLTDNFGYGDTHLAPGMGNVPFKKIMEELAEKGYKGKKIVEAGGFPQHFGTSPFPYTLEAFGSQMYEGSSSYWHKTAGLQQGTYSGGFGRMLPQIHYETLGAGFLQLPTELGGSTATSRGSRMSGRPME